MRMLFMGALLATVLAPLSILSHPTVQGSGKLLKITYFYQPG